MLLEYIDDSLFHKMHEVSDEQIHRVLQNAFDRKVHLRCNSDWIYLDKRVSCLSEDIGQWQRVFLRASYSLHFAMIYDTFLREIYPDLRRYNLIAPSNPPTSGIPYCFRQRYMVARLITWMMVPFLSVSDIVDKYSSIWYHCMSHDLFVHRSCTDGNDETNHGNSW